MLWNFENVKLEVRDLTTSTMMMVMMMVLRIMASTTIIAVAVVPTTTIATVPVAAMIGTPTAVTAPDAVIGKIRVVTNKGFLMSRGCFPIAIGESATARQ